MSLNFTFLLVPQRANAILGAGDIVLDLITELETGITAFLTNVHDWWDTWDSDVLKPFLASIARLAARWLIQEITESTVAWINGGFQGNPAFISDPGAFLKHTADLTIGDMILNDPNLGFLCYPFRDQIKIQLGINYSSTFKENIGCTLSDVVGNVQSAAESATSKNNWNDWFALTTVPQNSPMGAYIIAQNELETRMATKVKGLTEKLQWGHGALAFSECTKVTHDSETGQDMGSNIYLGSQSYSKEKIKYDSETETYTTTTCVDKTPGALVTDMLSQATKADKETNVLIAALGDGIDQILAALMSAILQKATNQIQNGLLNPDSGLGNGNISSGGNYASTLQNLPAQLAANYDNGVNNINNNNNAGYGNYQVNSWSPNDIPNYVAPTAQINDHPDTNNLDTTPNPTGTNPNPNPNPNPVVNPPVNNSSLETQRNSALVTVNVYKSGEIGYQSDYNQGYSLLSAAINPFTVAHDCYATRGDYIKAGLIQRNIIDNINGISENREVTDIPWSLPNISIFESTSQNRVNNILNPALQDITAATTAAQIQTALDSLNPLSQFRTSPVYSIFPSGIQQPLLDAMKNWLLGMRDSYTIPDTNNPQDTGCSQADLSSVF